jgi:tetratricopeptide (TPR) repeat protein
VGNHLSAEDDFSKASTLIFDDAALWLSWSEMYYEMGDFSKACELIFDALEEYPDNADIYYRAVVYLIKAGLYKEALLYLENALTLDFEKHTQLYDFFTEVSAQKAFFKIIEQYKNNNN